MEGHVHPLAGAIREVHDIFRDLGYEVAMGSELIPETENFDLLNFKQDHPARDTHDTFWVKGTRWTPSSRVPRTHISSLQVPFMRRHGVPLRMVSSGPVYRAEATDATHEAQFHYTEGLVVEEGVSLAHLKGTIETFLTRFFGHAVMIRFRPGNFPFVEPGVEVDMRFTKASGEERWLEVMGAGMVHPEVLRQGRVPEGYRGFAFGMGINRLVMIRNGITDIRVFYSGDLRFVSQF